MSENEGLDKKHLRTFLSNVDQEIINIQAGESKFRHGAMHFEKGTCPALNRLKMFRDYPTKKNLEQFIALAGQDFGQTAAEAFRTWSARIHDELTPAAEKKPVVRPFDVVIKDGFYDMFKATRIPLDQKQVDLLEKNSAKLSRAFRDEISKEVKTQLEALVSKLETKKPKAQSKSPYEPQRLTGS